MRVLESLIGAVVTAVVVAVLAHHLHMPVDLLTLAGVAFLVTFVVVLARSCSCRSFGRGRR